MISFFKPNFFPTLAIFLHFYIEPPPMYLLIQSSRNDVFSAREQSICSVKYFVMGIISLEVCF